MEPLIAGPPFVRALEELVAVHRGHAPEILQFDPADARKELAVGRCAMAVTWPSRMDNAAEEPTGAPVLPLAVTELPGSREVFHLGDRQWQARDHGDDGRVTLLGVAGRVGEVS